MRKLLTMLLVALMLISLVACGNDDNPTSSNTSESTSDVTTTTTGDNTTTGDDITTGDDTTTGDDDTTTKGNDKTTTKKDDKTTTKKDDKTTTKKDDKTTTKKDDKTTTKKTTTSTTKTNTPSITDAEQPMTSDTSDYYNPKTSRYETQANAMRDAALSTKDSGLKPSGNGKTYYISATKGDDSNSGTSKSAPWRTAKNLNNGYAASGGSVILFERGGVYRNVCLNLNRGVSVGAYGTGPKPQLLGGDKDYADEKLWKSAGNNIWYTDATEAVQHCPGDSLMPEDIGNIIFDYGKKVASEYKQLAMKRLDSDYDFFYEKSTSRLYLYLSKGNPGKVHSSIELSPNYETIRIRTHDHIIENLCIRYSASGIGTAGANNITVRGCELGYIGGGRQSNSRAGNAITFFNTTDNCWWKITGSINATMPATPIKVSWGRKPTSPCVTT